MLRSEPSESHPDLDALDRVARERLGLPEDHVLRKRLRVLKRRWDRDLYETVLRGLNVLSESLAGFNHASERIPPEDVFSGDLCIGHVKRPDGRETKVNMPSDRLTLNMIVIGLIGAGKTHFVRMLLRMLLGFRPDVRILVLDPNRSYEGLPSESPGSWVDIAYYDTRTNVLRAPEGYPYAAWKNQAIDLLARGELMHSRYFLMERLDSLYARFGVPALDDGKSLLPSLFDLRDDLLFRKCKPGSAEDRYRGSSVGVIDGRLRATGDVFNCSRGVEDLLINARTRISTEGMAPLENVRFYHSHWLHYAYRKRLMAPRIEPPRLWGVTVCEEAQALLERRDDAPLPVMQEIILRSRAVGLGNIFVCQDISRVDSSVLSAIGTFVVFAQSNAENKRAIQRLLDLSNKETALLGELAVGECFVKFVGHPTWPFPLLMKVPR